MKKSRYSNSQIIAIIKQVEAGTPVPELCREGNPPLITVKEGLESRTKQPLSGHSFGLRAILEQDELRKRIMLSGD